MSVIDGSSLSSSYLHCPRHITTRGWHSHRRWWHHVTWWWVSIGSVVVVVGAAVAAIVATVIATVVTTILVIVAPLRVVTALTSTALITIVVGLRSLVVVAIIILSLTTWVAGHLLTASEKEKKQINAWGLWSLCTPKYFIRFFNVTRHSFYCNVNIYTIVKVCGKGHSRLLQNNIRLHWEKQKSIPPWIL